MADARHRYRVGNGVSALAPVLCGLLLFSSSVHALTPEQWLEDFRQLLGEMSSHYANLDSAVKDRRIDLAEIRKTAETRIAAAKTDGEAKAAIDWFLRQFGDGHARVDWSKSESVKEKPRPICERLGYTRRDAGGLDFSKVDGFTALNDADSLYFPAGILRLSDKRKPGMLRIHLFTETAHPELCTQAQKELGIADGAECGSDCFHRMQIRTGNLLTAALERRIEALQRAGATAIVVDLTGNGGGNDWVEPAARVLTPVPLRSPRVAFLRHPHWSNQLRQHLHDIEADLRDKAEPRAVLKEAADTIRTALKEAEKPCDRSGVWSDAPTKPDCSLVVAEGIHSTGVLAYAKPGTFAETLRSRGRLFYPSQYSYREGLNRLPLIVVTDGGTASASELFVASMRDNNAARIIGTPTNGSGCGYTDGGIAASLKHSGGTVKLPDCIRLRADGTNEVLGIIPDVLVPWGWRDSRYQRAMNVVRVLETVVKR